MKDTKLQAEEEKPHWTTGREKLDMVAGYAGWLAQENARLENGNLPARPFDPDTAFETIRLRKGRRPTEDATTAGDATPGRVRLTRLQGSPSLRQLGDRYRLMFRAYQVVRRKERLFSFKDPSVPAREATLHAAREALFARLTRTGHRRRW